MKRLIPFLLFSTATVYSTIEAAPVSAMGCNASSNNDKIECKKGEINCEKKNSNLISTNHDQAYLRIL